MPADSSPFMLAALAALTTLDLAGVAYDSTADDLIGPEGVHALALSPYLAHLRTLDLRGSNPGRPGFMALAASPYLTRVEQLGLTGTVRGSKGKDGTRIGFIGLGAMGSRMAANILNGGYAMVVYNRDETRAREIAGRGAEVAASPREVAERSTTVITMLSDPAAVRAAGWTGRPAGGRLRRPGLDRHEHGRPGRRARCRGAGQGVRHARAARPGPGQP